MVIWTADCIFLAEPRRLRERRLPLLERRPLGPELELARQRQLERQRPRPPPQVFSLQNPST